MFCPQCGQERVSVATNYCSRCGFLLIAVTDLLRTGGQNPLALLQTGSQPQSPRKRGIKQGVFLFLLTFLVAPLMGMISLAIGIRPFGVGIAVVICFIGGLLRMIYAAMFESAEPGAPTLEEKVIAGAAALNSPVRDQRSLPPDQQMPVSSFMPPGMGNWRDTNDLDPITESRTKLLEKDEQF